MERKNFLKNAIGLLNAATIIDACKKTNEPAETFMVKMQPGISIINYKEQKEKVK